MSGLLDMNNWVMLWHVKQFLKSSMWGFYHQTSVLVRIDKSWFWCWIATCHLQIERSLCHSIFIIFLFVHFRASGNFWGCPPQSPPKNLGQIPAALAISGIFERFSPGPNGSEVGPPWGQFLKNSEIQPSHFHSFLGLLAYFS